MFLRVLHTFEAYQRQMCGKYFKRKHRITKHMRIKHKHILFPGRRYQDSRHLLQNPKVSKNVMGFNNHAQRSTSPYYLDVDNPLGKNAPVYNLYLFLINLLNARDRKKSLIVDCGSRESRLPNLTRVL